MPQSEADLDRALLAAHAEVDKVALMRLYADAAERRARAGFGHAARYFWTQAYVWALDAGCPEAQDLHRRLVLLGSEE